MANRWIVGKVNPSIHCKLVESLQNHPQMMFTELFQPTLQFSVRLFGSCKSCMLCFFIFSDFQPREMTFWYSKLSTPLHGESVGKALTGRCQGPDHPSDRCPPSWLYHSWHFRLVENVKHSRVQCILLDVIWWEYRAVPIYKMRCRTCKTCPSKWLFQGSPTSRAASYHHPRKWKWRGSKTHRPGWKATS